VRDALVLVADLCILRGRGAEGDQVRAVDVATSGGKDGRDGPEHADVRVAGGELDEVRGRAVEEELQRLVERLHADLGGQRPRYCGRGRGARRSDDPGGVSARSWTSGHPDRTFRRGVIELSDTDAVIFAFRRNIVVAASAGTGKTHRLTALYLLLTLGLTSMGEVDERTPAPAVGPERIVATTFSRAAALEIATRIERALREIVAWDGTAKLVFGDAIRAREEATGQPLAVGDLKRRAADALLRWPSARIDTLHGVARRVVQRHALAIGLAPGTRVLDEEEAQALGDLAVDEALGAALSEGGERAEAARGLIVSCAGVWGARRLILRLLDRLDEEGLGPEDLALADHLAQGRAVAGDLTHLARRLAALGSPTFREPAAALSAALGAPADPSELCSNAAAESLHELFVRRMPARGKRLPPDDELFDLVDGLPGKTKSERAMGLVSLLRNAPLIRAREVRMAALIGDARARFAVQKRRAGALGFGDLLRVARDALRDRPEIARAVREEVGVLLVDEFQDTSRVQRDLVYLLREREDAAAARAAGERRASPRADGLTGHGLFLVGDRKQSIYGFRGADVAVFSRIAAELAGRAAGEALSLPAQAWAGVEPVADFVALRESRRSGPEILAFVNAFSERDFAEDRPAGAPPRAYEIAYGPAEHLVPVLSAEPARVVFLADDGASPEGADPIVRESSGAAREAFVAAAYVAALVAQKGDAPVRYQDIAVLARRRSSIPLVELGLSRLGVPYVVAGRALYDAPEVRDIAALLRLLLDPRDRLAMATVLRGPVVALSDASLAALSVPGRGLTVPLQGRWPAHKPAPAGDAAAAPLFDQADPAALPHAERVRLDAFRARFGDVRRAALRLPPGEAIRATMSAFDLDRVLAALPRAEARIGNLDRLVTIARRRGGTLSGFVRWLDRRMRDDADEAEAAVFSPEDDAVRLTTIHASKGLDFPVVVLVDLNAAPRGDHGALGFVALDEGETPTLVVRHYAPRGDGRVLAPLATSTLRAAQADARAREHAERRRLTYVAVTRARRALVLVGAAGTPRGGSALRSLANGLEQGDLEGVITAIEPAAAILAAETSAPPPERRREAPPDARPPLRPARSPARDVAVDAAALALFRDCPRRFRLRHLLGVEEPAAAAQLDLFAAAVAKEPIVDLPPPVAADDDRGRGPRPLHRAAHRVLARWPLAGWGAPVDPVAVAARLVAEGLAPGDAETDRLARAIARFVGGPYARRAREEGATVARDEPYVLPVEAPGKLPRRVLLRGVIDLKVSYPGGRVDVIEVSLSRAHADASVHDFPLRAAALSARGAGGVRAGVLPLGSEAEPVWLRGRGAEGMLAAEEHARFEKELGALGQRMAEARYEDRFEGVAVGACRKLGCGFVEACHGAAAEA
jgi:ATP-dependent helicase/nuclease subunit A